MSCEKDDTALKCLTDCTVVQGQLVTANGEPLKNIPVAFSHYVSHGIGGSYRRIKKTETDKNGFYRMEFFIEEDELGKYAKGLFELKIDYGELDPRVYMNTQPFYIHTIYSIAKRDTTMTLDFYNPKKTYISINLTNFLPTSSFDDFIVRSFYPTGRKIGQNSLLDTEYQIRQGSEVRANSVNTVSDSVLVASRDMNRIGVDRRKNGVELETEYFTIYVPENNNIELTYEY
jgi:hypothetical protein